VTPQMSTARVRRTPHGQDSLLEIAVGEFITRGYDATSMEDLSRAAGINLTKSLANEYASDHILVNTVCLGLVKSAQWERRAKGDLEGYYREVAKRVPVGRVGEAEEFADLVAFLCSARAAYITGTAINFDGGMSAAF